MEQTLVIIKPDGMQRNLVGEIIKRFEKSGLRISALKMLKASRQLIAKHYSEDEEYLISLGKKSEKAGDVVKDYKAQGKMIVEGMRNYMTSGPVVAMVVTGDNAIQAVRKIAGYTDPSTAEKGTIRGDFGQDSILAANREKRPVRNLLHASGNREEAKKEISLWFSRKEILL